MGVAFQMRMIKAPGSPSSALQITYFIARDWRRRRFGSIKPARPSAAPILFFDDAFRRPVNATAKAA
jgi:hypothetical protein